VICLAWNLTQSTIRTVTTPKPNPTGRPANGSAAGEAEAHGREIHPRRSDPTLSEDLLEWGRWFEHNDRRVRLTRAGPYFVWTIFLGLDHSWGRGRPQLFETMMWIEQKTLSPAFTFPATNGRPETEADEEATIKLMIECQTPRGEGWG
jgi:hypothetical protein